MSMTGMDFAMGSLNVTHKVISKSISISGGSAIIYIDTSDLDTGKTLIGANIANWTANDATLVMPKTFEYNTNGHLLTIRCYAMNSPAGSWGWAGTSTTSIDVDLWQV